MHCEIPGTSFGIVGWKYTWDEFQRARFYKDVLLEGFATFCWLTGVTLAQMEFEARAASPYTKAVLGLYCMAILEAWMHVNPTAINATSTIVFCVTKKISVLKGIFYLITQFGCGIGATQLVFSITPANITALVKAPGPGAGVSEHSCWILEWLCVVIYMVVILSATDKRKKRPMLPHLAIGFCLVALSLYAGPYGVSLNPITVVSFAVATNDFSNVWIYVTAGPVGGITAAIVYNVFILDYGYHCAISNYQNPYKTLTQSTTMVSHIGKVNDAFTSDIPAKVQYGNSDKLSTLQNGHIRGVHLPHNQSFLHIISELDEQPPGGDGTSAPSLEIIDNQIGYTATRF